MMCDQWSEGEETYAWLTFGEGHPAVRGEQELSDISSFDETFHRQNNPGVSKRRSNPGAHGNNRMNCLRSSVKWSLPMKFEGQSFSGPSSSSQANPC